MTIHLHKKHLILLLAAALVLGSLYAGAYYLFIKPVNAEIDSLSSMKTMQEEQLQQKKSSDTSTQTKPVVNSVELQRKVPVSPMVEQLVLDLEKAETVSNSRIQNVTFAESEDALLPPAAPVEPEADQPSENQAAAPEEDGTQETADSEEKQDSSPAVAAQSPAPLPDAPEGLKRVILSLEVTSRHYFDMETFIETLEQQPRVTKVDILTFEGLPELTSLDQETEPLTYTLQVSAFYASGLQDLSEETPKVAAPQPSNKFNPLSPSLETEDGE